MWTTVSLPQSWSFIQTNTYQASVIKCTNYWFKWFFFFYLIPVSLLTWVFVYMGEKFSHDLLNQYCRTQNITGDQETWALIQPCYSNSAVWPWEKACPFPNHMVSFPIKWVHWVMWALKFCLYLSFLSDDQIHVAFFLPHCDSPHLPVCTHGVHS